MEKKNTLSATLFQGTFRRVQTLQYKRLRDTVFVFARFSSYLAEKSRVQRGEGGPAAAGVSLLRAKSPTTAADAVGG